MKKLVITESEKNRILKLHNSKEPLKEGFLTGLLVLTAVGIANLLFNLKNYNSLLGSHKNFPHLIDFTDKVRQINDGEKKGEVFVEKIKEDYLITVKLENEEPMSIFVDADRKRIYTDETRSEKITPLDSINGEKIDDRVSHAQNILIRSVRKIIEKFSEKV